MEFRVRAMDLWFRHLPGALLVEAELLQLKGILPQMRGNYVLQIGGVSDLSLLKQCPIAHKYYVGLQPASHHEGWRVQTDLQSLPIMPNSIDAVVLAHMLEFVDEPLQLLNEIDLALNESGQLVIMGFNPFSSWGVSRWLRGKKGFPWKGTFIKAHLVRAWLRQHGYRIVVNKTIFFKPPVHEMHLAKRWQFLENLGPMIAPWCGAAYIISAQKRTASMTPLLNKEWKKESVQQSGFVKPTTRAQIDE